MCHLKSFCLCSFFILTSISSNAQELVPNGSFEEFYHCPTRLDQLDSVKYWRRANDASTDYFNTCGSNDAGAPFTYCGYKNPRTGNAFAVIVQFYYGGMPSGSFPEYLEVPLSNPLVTNNCYDFEMYVSVGNRYGLIASNIGVYFSDTFLHKAGNFYIPLSPHINNAKGNYPDTSHWLRVGGKYRAHGGEKYLTIGNFESPSLVDTINMNWALYNTSYIFVDDVSLKKIADPCPLDVKHVSTKTTIKVSPNPFAGDLLVRSSDSSPYRFILYEITGRALLEQNFIGSVSIKTEALPLGMYYFSVMSAGEVIAHGTVVKQ